VRVAEVVRWDACRVRRFGRGFGILGGGLNLRGDDEQIASGFEQDLANVAARAGNDFTRFEFGRGGDVCTHLREAAFLRSPRGALHAIIVDQVWKGGSPASGAFVVISRLHNVLVMLSLGTQHRQWDPIRRRRLWIRDAAKSRTFGR
jgi:hypothetical protein